MMYPDAQKQMSAAEISPNAWSRIGRCRG